VIYNSSQNWYSWSYDGVKYSRSQTHKELFETQFNIKSVKCGSFRKELQNAAKDIMDHYPGLRPSVMFSGGVDSEIVLRAFIDIGSNPNVYIGRYNNDYNIYDVSYAITICSMLGIDYKIVDLNIEKFFENDAESISELGQLDRPLTLPQMKLMEQVDGLPIYCTGEPSWNRLDDDYSKKGTWLMSCWEHDIGWTKYSWIRKRPAVMEFFKWTPELLLAWNTTKWIPKLINDHYYGRLGTNSTKIIGYREAYQELIDRKKKTGFENCSELINEFETFLEKKYNGLPFRRHCDRTYNQLLSDLCQDLSTVPSYFER
jgi:hypothetical protein